MGATHLRSKSEEINQSAISIHNFFSDLRNLKNILPEDKVENFEASKENCSFYLVGISNLKLILEETSNEEKIIYQSIENSYQIKLSLFIRSLENSKSEYHLELDAEFPKIIKMMAEKPLQSVINKMADKIKQIHF